MIIRKNARDLQGPEKKAFTDAVLALKRQPSQLHPGDATRGRYDDYVEVHLNAMMAMMSPAHMQNWGHLSAAFGPWHRGYLKHFEAELRATSAAAANVSLPYWDWTDPASTAAVFAADFLGGNGRAGDGQVMDGPFAFAAGGWKVVIKDDPSNPDFLERRFAADQSAMNLPDATMQTETMALTVYDEAPWYDSKRRGAQRGHPELLFRYRLEYDLHNLVHRYIGGDMALASSPNDPVFWLHHCNLDRLWSLWEQTTGIHAPYAPKTGGPAGQSGDKALIYNFPGGTPPWPGTIKPQDLYDSRAQIGIGYDTDVVPAPVPHPQMHMSMAMPEHMAMPQPMKMSAKDMYPLRSEVEEPHVHTAASMFPLRSEIDA